MSRRTRAQRHAKMLQRSLYRRFEVDGQTVTARVNRRGATKPWTAEADRALGELVAAVHRMHREGNVPLRSSAGLPPGEAQTEGNEPR